MASPPPADSIRLTASATVLVADDSGDTRDFLKELLVSESFSVITAENGAEALEIMRGSRPDAVLLDLMMPILSGWQVLEECQRNEELREIPVICLSALSDMAQRVRARGAVAFVPKPIDCTDLLVALRQFAAPTIRKTSAGTGASVPSGAGPLIPTAIRESEHLFRTLMEQAWDGILLLDANGNCVVANPSAAGLFGYDLERLCQLTFHDLVEYDGPVVADTPLSERTCRRHDGSIFIGEVSIKTIDRSRTHVFVRDVTRARQLEEEYRQAQKMDAMGHLAGGIAHDFNNILTVIIGASEVVIEELGQNHRAIPDLRDIHASGCRAAALTQQLLAFSRKQVLNIHPLDVHAEIETFTSMLCRLLPENIDLRVNLKASTTMIQADQTQLDQLLLNLAVNANAAMPQGGRLTLSTENITDGRDPLGARIRITVADTGVGMDDETQRRIFEPFFTTKPAGQGTGLGLAMVYGTVQQLGGAISVESAVGKGTTFQLTFPCASSGEIASTAGKPISAPVPEGHGTLLIVEDESSLRLFVAKALENRGYRVFTADGPTGALTFLRDRRSEIDLIITDVMMPKMTGPELIGRIRQDGPCGAVLYISGYMADPGALGVGRPGIDYLPKPFTIEQLSERVLALLTDHRRGRTLSH